MESAYNAQILGMNRGNIPLGLEHLVSHFARCRFKCFECWPVKAAIPPLKPGTNVSRAAGREKCRRICLCAQYTAQKAGIIPTDQISSQIGWMAPKNRQATDQFPIDVSEPECIQVTVYYAIRIRGRIARRPSRRAADG